MDPDTARIVAEIAAQATQTGATIGVIGAVCGALIGVFGGFLAGRNQIHGQRLLARDADRRRRREARVQPLIDQAKRRSALRIEAIQALHRGQFDVAAQLVERLGRGEGFDSDASYAAIGSKEVVTAFEQLLASDVAVVQALQSILGRQLPQGRGDELGAKLGSAQRTTDVAFFEAAETYIDSG